MLECEGVIITSQRRSHQNNQKCFTKSEARLGFGQSVTMMHRLKAPDPLRKRLTLSYLPTTTSKSFTTCLSFSMEDCLSNLYLGHLLTLLLLHIHQIIWHLLHWCPFPTESHWRSGQPPQLRNMIPQEWESPASHVLVFLSSGDLFFLFSCDTLSSWLRAASLPPLWPSVQHLFLTAASSASSSYSFPLNSFFNLIEILVSLTFNFLIHPSFQHLLLLPSA